MDAPSRRTATLTCACALALGISTTFFSAALARTSQGKPSKDALTAGSMEDLHRLIRLQPGEYRWDEVPWYASIWHARKAAAAEDKPIFVFGTGGAGSTTRWATAEWPRSARAAAVAAGTG